MSKRGQGLSMNAIVVAALALIVLVVLIFIFTKLINSTGTGYVDIGNSAIGGASGKACESLLGGKICLEGNRLQQFNRNSATPIISPCKEKNDDGTCRVYGWKDCGNNNCYYESDLKKT